METSLQPDSTDTTNDLLRQLILVMGGANTSIPGQDSNIRDIGASSTPIWIQAVAYTSLATSLLAAFGAVMGKQWLAHYRSSRFGRGSLHERCKTRHRKFIGLKEWHLDVILDTLPTILQLSLLFFGIALTANIWTLQPTLGIILLASSSLGVIFFVFTVFVAVTSSNSPFESRFTA